MNFLYQGSFNPSSPLANVIRAQDPLAGDLSNNAPFTQALTAGTNYFLVKTGFSSTNAGTYSNTIDGPGNITGAAAAVPEPFTIIGTLVGGTAALRLRKKLKAANKA